MPRRAPAPRPARSARRRRGRRSGENSVDLVAVVDGHPAADAKVEMLEFARLPGGESASAAVALARLGCRGALHRPGRRRRLRPAGPREPAPRGGGRQPGGHRARARPASSPSSSSIATPAPDRDLEPPPGPGDVAGRHPAARRSPTPASSWSTARSRRPMTAAAERARRAGARTVVDVERVRPGIDAPAARRSTSSSPPPRFPRRYTGQPSRGAALAALQAETRRRGRVRDPRTRRQPGPGRRPRVPHPGLPVAGRGHHRGRRRLPGRIHRRMAGRRRSRPNWTTVLRWANAVAALKCRGLGARTASPTRAEVEALLAQAM